MSTRTNLFLSACILAAAPQAKAAGALLPAGYLTTSGSQIVDLSGHPVRLACAGYFEVVTTIAQDLTGMVADGFNCLRFPWYNATLAGSDLPLMKQIVAEAGTIGLKVILDHHGDETPGPGNGYLPYPCNGLPIDKGPGTDGTDGCGDVGTVTLARYVSDWGTVAKTFAGNSTVIGFDLTNEPHLFPSYWSQNPGGATWGDGSATDLRAMYSQAAAAIQSVNPGALIIAEGIENFTTALFSGGTPLIPGYADLTTVVSYPVTMPHPAQLVYSVHDYPVPISGVTPDSGAVKIKGATQDWGYLVVKGIAPVWIGEMGGSLDGVGPDSTPLSNLKDERAWISTLLNYLNGQDGSKGGPTFGGCAQPVSTDWWAWGNLDGESPDGTLGDNGKPRHAQHAVTVQLQFVPKQGC
jgi:aryl-phospho-beta-D-glucosidase BglC (GH1 family)